MPLFGGLCNNDESLFFFFLRIHLYIPEGAFITLCPGCRHLPPSDPPAQKGGLVRHMKPAPPDIWTRRSPLAEHEAVLNATDSERRALVPGPNSPAKWMQLGPVGVAGVGVGGGEPGCPWPPLQAPPRGNLKGKFAFRRGSSSCLRNTVSPAV